MTGAAARPMRVLLVISGLSLGGAERQVVLLSREMARLGHSVCIYTLNRETARMDELAGSAVEVVVDQKRTRLDWSVLARLRRHIRHWRPDIVHGFLFDGDFYSRLAAAGLRTPVLNSERNDNYALSLVQRIGYRLTSRLCAGVVANSYAGADFAQRIHRLPRSRVHVVWNGIDLLEVDARLAVSTRPALDVFAGDGLKRICMVASIKPQKDYVLALETMRKLVDRDPTWRLICVGDKLSDATDSYKTEVLARLGDLALEPYVRFVGHRRDVPELIGSSDLMLVTSVREGFPNVVLEAMACGTAVVSTAYSDVRRILVSPRQVVDSRSADDIAEAVIRCHAQRAEISASQRDWVLRHGTASASARRMLQVYEQYVGPGTRSTAARTS